MNTENQVYRELQRYLDRMMRKGLILTVEEGYDEAHYCNAEFAMGGIFNFQVNRLSEDMFADYHQYQAEKRAKARPGTGGRPAAAHHSHPGEIPGQRLR